MQVSAQVTAMTTLIEVLANCVNAVIWVFIANRAGYATLTQAMLLYFVILPYTFSLNTEHNRNCVVENGWANVLKNGFHRGNASLPNHNQREDNNNAPPYGLVPQFGRYIRGIFRSINTGQTETVKTFSNQDGCTNTNNSAIYTIFRNEHCFPSTCMELSSLDLNVPLNEEPCSSQSIFQTQTSRLSEEDDIDLQDLDCRVYLRSQIISSMLSNIRNEGLYTQHFTRLLRFEDDFKNGHKSNFFSSEYLDTAVKTITKSKSKGKKGKHSGHNLESQLGSNKGNKTCCNLPDEADEEKTREVHPMCVGDNKRRIKMRTRMINLMKFNEYNEDMYDEFLQNLINMEESFAEENC